MKNCHNDHDSHLIRDWSEAHSGGGNRFFQVSTFISIATANIYHLYEVFFQKTHLLLPLALMWTGRIGGHNKRYHRMVQLEARLCVCYCFRCLN